MLAGIALTLLPWLWRRRLGDVGAFAAAVVLGCSPLLLAASRRVEGTTLGLLGAALLATALFSAEEPDAAGPSRRMLPALIITGLRWD
jgi:predicted membrane-bound mannosyltransferase